MNDEHKPPAPDKPQAAEAPQPAPEPPAVEAPQTPSPVTPAPESASAPAPAPKEPAAEPTAAQRRRLLLDMPVDVRSASLVVLAVLASVFALQWGQAVFIPLMLSLLLTYALSPVVERLHRWHVPRWIGAAVILDGPGRRPRAGRATRSRAARRSWSTRCPVAAQKLGTGDAPRQGRERHAARERAAGGRAAGEGGRGKLRARRRRGKRRGARRHRAAGLQRARLPAERHGRPAAPRWGSSRWWPS
jgi:hypothetical protein